MLQVSAERLIAIPLAFSEDTEPSGGAQGDPEVPGGSSKPPSGNQPADGSEGPGSNAPEPGDDIIIKNA